MINHLVRFRAAIASFGPGLLYAGAAVGVSHLVQSTRAGAEFGYQLLLVVIIVNLIKYPIFEIGPRYAAATGDTLLDGYRKLGAWAVWLYVIVSVTTMFIVMGAIAIVTAGLFANLLELDLEAGFLAVVLLLISALILGFGHYKVLDRTMKFIIVLLTVSTVAAVLTGLLHSTPKLEEYQTAFDLSDKSHLLFLVALVGWMPAPIDLSIWHSVWSVSKNRSRAARVEMKSALLDFKIGYWGTMLIAACFLTLGAMLMYGTPENTSASAVAFAGQIVQMYTQNLGNWAYPIIALAAFTTMFSTMLTCLDAFPRTLRRSTKLLFPSLDRRRNHASLYWFWIFVTFFGASIVLLNLHANMKQMVDLATTISFVVAPLLAILNFVVMKRDVAKEHQPPKRLQHLNILAMVALSLFSVWFILYRF